MQTMKNLSRKQIEIVDAALDIISNQGVRRMTVKNLSQALGVSEPALYRHFNSKFEILMAILTGYGSDFAALINRKIIEDGKAVDTIDAMYRELFRWFVRRPALSVVLFSDDLLRYDRRLSLEANAIIEMTHERINEILRGGVRRGEVRKDVPVKHLAWMIMGTVRLLITRWRMSGFTANLVKEGDVMLKYLHKVIAK